MQRKKIIFAVAGEGIGHATRASIIINYLTKKKKCQVKILTYHLGYWHLSKKFKDVVKIFGLRFAHKNGHATYTGTVLKNIKKTPDAVQSFLKIKKIVKEFQPDLIITDLEPFTSLVANIYNIPLISIDNQHRITQGEIEYEKKWLLNYLINKIGVSAVAINADAYIITSFFKFKKKAPNVYIVPPILDENILRATPGNKDYILVYNSTKNKNLQKALCAIKDTRFIVYGYNTEKKNNHCQFKRRSHKRFLNDLINARAVIGTSGLSLMSEAIHLRKPFLALPIKKRIEQLTNAYYLKKLKFGDYSEDITVEDIEKFINKIDFYRQNLKKRQRTDNSKLYKLLDTLLEKL